MRFLARFGLAPSYVFEWHEYRPPFWGKVRFVDGTIGYDFPVLRRLVGGQWQYRRLNAHEDREWLEEQAW